MMKLRQRFHSHWIQASLVDDAMMQIMGIFRIFISARVIRIPFNSTYQQILFQSYQISKSASQNMYYQERVAADNFHSTKL